MGVREVGWGLCKKDEKPLLSKQWLLLKKMISNSPIANPRTWFQIRPLPKDMQRKLSLSPPSAPWSVTPFPSPEATTITD